MKLISRPGFWIALKILFFPAFIVIVLNIENWANKLGISTILADHAGSVMGDILTFVRSTWVQIPALLIIGASLALWIDRRLRRQETSGSDDIIGLEERVIKLEEKAVDFTSQQNFEMETKLGHLTERIEKLADIVKNHGSDIVNRIEADRSLEARIEALSGKIDSSSTNLADIKSEVENTETQMVRGYQLLSRVLHARDAETMLKEADKTILLKGKKLLDPTDADYTDDDAWAQDFAAWKIALDKIDDIAERWIPTHRRFLDIRLPDYEAGGPAPPSHITVKSDVNMVRYKTIWLAHLSYVNRRDGILAYFASKAIDF
jgi:hypothetical protein